MQVKNLLRRRQFLWVLLFVASILAAVIGWQAPAVRAGMATVVHLPPAVKNRADSQSVDILSPNPDRGVLITDCGFTPSTIIIPAGGTVGWLNASLEISHTVTSDAGLWDSGEIAPGGNYSRTFSTVSTFSYHDRLNPDFTGQIIVRHLAYLPFVAKNYMPGVVLPQPTTGDVTGQVLSAENTCRGLEGATVTLVSTPPFTVTTDTEGHYHLMEVPPGVYTATATLDGYLAQTQPITVTAGETAYANFVLSRAPTRGGISFYLYHALTGALLVEVPVTVQGTLRRSPGDLGPPEEFELHTTTGFVATVNRPEGTYQVTATAPGFETTTLDVDVGGGQQALVSVMLPPAVGSSQVETRHNTVETQTVTVLGHGGLHNGDFNTGTLPPWTFSEFHNPGQPTPAWSIPDWVFFSSPFPFNWLYRPLRLFRATTRDGGTGAVSQPLNWDISGFCTMRLDFDVAIKHQGFPGDLTRFGEYPAKVVLSYRDTAGDPRTFTRAFYLAASRVDAFAERIPRDIVVHRSYDLKAVTPPIRTITGIRLESSGWDWDTYFDNVRLYVDPRDVPVGLNTRFYDADVKDHSGGAFGGAWHRETASLPTRQAFSQSFAVGPGGSADSWAWVGRTFRVCGTTPRAAEIRVTGEYRGMIEALAGYPIGYANVRWRVEATLSDQNDPGNFDSVTITERSCSLCLPQDQNGSFNVRFPVRTLQPWHEYLVLVKISDQAQAVGVASAAADFYGRGDPSSARYIRYDYIGIEWK